MAATKSVMEVVDVTFQAITMNGNDQVCADVMTGSVFSLKL